MAIGAVLLLFSAVLHAAWNALAKGSKDKEALLFGMTAISAGITLLLILFTQGSFPTLTGSALFYALLAGVFEGFYLGSLSKALQGGPLGQAYAIMRGGAMVLVWFVSVSFLNEIPKSLHILGAIFIFSGMLILNYRTSEKKAEKSGLNIWAFLSAIFIASYHISYHQALSLNSDPQALFFISMLMSLPCLWIGMGRSVQSRVKEVWSHYRGRIILTAAFSTASFLIFLYGLRVSAPGYAISLRNSSIFFALIFSFFLKESLSRVQIFGACIIGAGTIFLSL